MTFHPYSALFLLPLMFLLLELGYRLRLRRKAVAHSTAIEGAVFALFGLLLAFTFSGAVARFDTHRQLATQEANDIGTAYLRLDLLPVQEQPALRQLFRDYVSSRMGLYETVSLEVTPLNQRLQNEIWKRVISAASAQGASPDAVKLLLPALNDMIDITTIRQNAFYMHPPAAVYLLLFTFSCGAAFLAGFGMTEGGRSWLYTIALALTVTATVYTTLEIEYPRQGLLHLTGGDQMLMGLRNSMH